MKFDTWIKQELRSAIAFNDSGIWLLVSGVIASFTFIFAVQMLLDWSCHGAQGYSVVRGVIQRLFLNVSSCISLDASLAGKALMLASGACGYIVGNILYKLIRDWSFLEFRMSTPTRDLSENTSGSKYRPILYASIALGILFYWFEYRPSEIRKTCAKEANRNAQFVARAMNRFYAEDGIIDSRVRDNEYKSCIQARGLQE